MKKNFLILASIFLSLFAMVSCSESESVDQGGPNAAIFLSGPSESIFVFAGSGGREVDVDFGILRQFSGSHTVKLVLDAELSNLVEGVDFEYVVREVQLNAGEQNGTFKIKFNDDTASQEGKMGFFKLESTTLAPAAFADVYTLTVTLACDVDTFFYGVFQGDTYWLGDSVNEIAAGATTGEFKVVDFWEDSVTDPDFILNYNPNTFVVSFTEQSTGYFHSTYQEYIIAKPMPSGGVSTINPCTRVLNVYVSYEISAGYFNRGFEVFTGI